MSDLYVPARHVPLMKHAPFLPPYHPNAPEPESDHQGVWDWTPRQDNVWQTAEARNVPLKAKRPLGGSEGIPETRPDTDDILNVALTLIVGISLAVIASGILKRTFGRS